MSANQLGSLTTDQTNRLRVYVNGTKMNRDPALLPLAADEQQISLVFGRPGPSADIPSFYDFSGV